MARKGKKGRKVRVDFRRNRQQRRRTDDWTRRYHEEHDRLADERTSESVRVKGELSRKRTILVDEQDAPIVDETLWRPGIVCAVYGLICRVEDEAGQPWDCVVRRVLRTLLIEQRSSVTVGDRVWFSDHAREHGGQRVGVIERVAPRRSALSRRDRRSREHTIVANADQLLIVTSVAQPALKPHLIDRYLVAAGKGDLRPIICFNKWDLAPETVTLEQEREWAARARGESDVLPTTTAETVVAEFERLGYRCIRTSATRGDGLDALRDALRGHMTVLSGQSGVGKSSLLNAIQPELGLAVREVSAENEKGRHTTSLATLFRLDFGGYVIDTPGIRQFDLWGVEPGELEAYFVEFLPLIPQCRFNDCHHSIEEGCAVVAAVERGAISVRRYYSYLKMLEEAAARRDRAQ